MCPAIIHFNSDDYHVWSSVTVNIHFHAFQVAQQTRPVEFGDYCASKGVYLLLDRAQFSRKPWHYSQKTLFIPLPSFLMWENPRSKPLPLLDWACVRSAGVIGVLVPRRLSLQVVGAGERKKKYSSASQTRRQFTCPQVCLESWSSRSGREGRRARGKDRDRGHEPGNVTDAQQSTVTIFRLRSTERRDDEEVFVHRSVTSCVKTIVWQTKLYFSDSQRVSRVKFYIVYQCMSVCVCDSVCWKSNDKEISRSKK